MELTNWASPNFIHLYLLLLRSITALKMFDKSDVSFSMAEMKSRHLNVNHQKCVIKELTMLYVLCYGLTKTLVVKNILFLVIGFLRLSIQLSSRQSTSTMDFSKSRSVLANVSNASLNIHNFVSSSSWAYSNSFSLYVRL